MDTARGMNMNVGGEAGVALGARHIEDGKGLYTIEYWGYASRQMPCTKDAGSCAYLDSVYGNHVTSMIFTFIMWAVLGTLLLLTLLFRVLPQSPPSSHHQTLLSRSRRSISTFLRRHLLPELPRFFPHTTKLQVLILALLCAYLTLFSFIGITYKTWITPIPNSPLHNTRSGIGGFADRLGAFAFALTPLTIALCARDSLLSLLTGIPYQSFAFLHRWTARIIVVQTFVHAIIWSVVEGILYQPQPSTYVEWIRQPYMVWGCVAQGVVAFLFVFSLRGVVRWTGYEFFRKTHWGAAVLYLGACWGHWRQLGCWVVASGVLMGMDLVGRMGRTWAIHWGWKDGEGGGWGFRSVPAGVQAFRDEEGVVLRLELEARHKAWRIGQHFFLTFPALSIWQAHPFTPASSPGEGGVQRHTYIVRACGGETRRLAELVENAEGTFPVAPVTTPVILQGAFGGSVVDRDVENVLAVTGGTGITYVVPVVMAALQDGSRARNIELVWTVRHAENLAWMGPELAYLKAQIGNVGKEQGDAEDKLPVVSEKPKKQFRIRIYVTRPRTTRRQKKSTEQDGKKQELDGSGGQSVPSEAEEDLEDLLCECPGFSITYLNNGRPEVSNVVNTFMEQTVEEGRTQVVGSGPPELGTQLRAAVASHNVPGEVWRGNARGDVECVWDDRVG